jgi:hypothetical protein
MVKADISAGRSPNEIVVTHGDESYTLKYTTGALVAVEERSGRTTGELAAEINQRVGFKAAGLLLWGALRAHHPTMTLEQVHDLIDRIGYQTAGAWIDGAIDCSLLKQASGNGTRPTKRQRRGTTR